MDAIGVVHEAWKRTWSYRALWVFGVVLSLLTFPWQLGTPTVDQEWAWAKRSVTVTPRDGETFWQALRRSMAGEVREANRDLSRLLAEEWDLDVSVNLVAIGAALAAVGLGASALAKVFRYTSEVALARMVARDARSGERVTVWRGLGLGWSSRAWRVLLVDLIVAFVWAAVCALLFVAILGPIPLWVGGRDGVVFMGALLTGSLTVGAVVVAMVASVPGAILARLARRGCALDGTGAIASLRHAAGLLLGDLRGCVVLWLTALAARAAWIVAMVPVALVLIAGGLGIGSLPVLGALTTSPAEPIVYSALGVGAVMFLVVLVLPLVLLNGVRRVFAATMWTLAYDALGSPEAVEQNAPIGVDRVGLRPAPAD